MPVQFICLHCQRKLSVSQRKVGAQLKCPMCQGTITVPTQEEGLALVELRDSLHGDQNEQDALSEFVVNDDRWDDHPPAEQYDNVETESLFRSSDYGDSSYPLPAGWATGRGRLPRSSPGYHYRTPDRQLEIRAI